MKSKLIVVLLCSFLVAHIGNVRSQTSGPIAEDPDVAAAIALLETYIENQMTYIGTPGISLAIVYDQELVWSRGYGFADLERRIPATTGTLYRIGSI